MRIFEKSEKKFRKSLKARPDNGCARPNFKLVKANLIFFSKICVHGAGCFFPKSTSLLLWPAQPHMALIFVENVAPLAVLPPQGPAQRNFFWWKMQLLAWSYVSWNWSYRSYDQDHPHPVVWSNRMPLDNLKKIFYNIYVR